jgi:hypothetical protein
MKEDEKFLKKAVEAIKNEPAGSNPPQEIIDATLAKLAESSDEYPPQTQKLFTGPNFTHNLTKIAAAAVLFISVGYAAARFTTPRPPDIEQIRAALEPTIRANLLNEMQLGLANCYVQLKDDLHQQYRQDLSQVAAQTLALSNSATNQLLEQLIEAINEAQMQDRQWFTAAVGEVEFNRQRDKAQLSNALYNLASQTEDEIQRTQQGLNKLMNYNESDSLIPNNFENSSNKNRTPSNIN